MVTQYTRRGFLGVLGGSAIAGLSGADSAKAALTSPHSLYFSSNLFGSLELYSSDLPENPIVNKEGVLRGLPSSEHLDGGLHELMHKEYCALLSAAHQAGENNTIFNRLRDEKHEHENSSSPRMNRLFYRPSTAGIGIYRFSQKGPLDKPMRISNEVYGFELGIDSRLPAKDLFHTVAYELGKEAWNRGDDVVGVGGKMTQYQMMGSIANIMPELEGIPNDPIDAYLTQLTAEVNGLRREHPFTRAESNLGPIIMTVSDTFGDTNPTISEVDKHLASLSSQDIWQKIRSPAYKKGKSSEFNGQADNFLRITHNLMGREMRTGGS